MTGLVVAWMIVVAVVAVRSVVRIRRLLAVAEIEVDGRRVWPR